MKDNEAITVDLDEELPVAANGPVLEDGAASVVDEDGDLVGSIPARAVANDDGSVTLPLRFPVALSIRSAKKGIRTDEFKQLTFYRLNGADMRAVQAASKESQPSVMLARSARMRETVMSALFDRMDGADIADASKVVESFFGSGRTTGRST